MNAEERYQEVFSKFQNKHLFELFYILVISVAFLFVKFNSGKSIPEGSIVIAFPFAFGLLHILASNILSFLYNLSWIIFPFALKVTPTFLKIFGVLLLIIGIAKSLQHGW